MSALRASLPVDRRSLGLLVVDDSAVVRTLITSWFEGQAWVSHLQSAADSAAAIAAVRRHAPDVVILDLEMPGLDGLWLIRRLRQYAPDASIIVCSGLARNGGMVALECLERGAKDIIAKPSAAEAGWSAGGFRDELIARVRALGGIDEQTLGASAARGSAKPLATRLRPKLCAPPQAILIGASTGGPQALLEMMTRLAPAMKRVPTVVAQHVPARFAPVLVDYFRARIDAEVSLARHGDILRPAHVYIAPGDRNLRIEGAANRPVAALVEPDRPRATTPSVDVLFESAAKCWRGAAVAVVLSGMGDDGVCGARAVRAAGGAVLVQDKKSSVVWGMPGMIAGAGLASAIAPPAGIAEMICARWGEGE